jgi:hypothetical protein
MKRLSVRVNYHEMDQRHIEVVRSVGGVDKGDIRELLREVDLAVWGDKEEVDMAFIISSILKSPELLGTLKFHDESLDRAETMKSLLLCLGNL